jgi:bifunctional ADP-heptose synthase (sugar kinase/adenylyltransferase)
VSGGRVVVLGDIVLDVEAEVRVERVTPDAGLPVLHETDEV